MATTPLLRKASSISEVIRIFKHLNIYLLRLISLHLVHQFNHYLCMSALRPHIINSKCETFWTSRQKSHQRDHTFSLLKSLLMLQCSENLSHSFKQILVMIEPCNFSKLITSLFFKNIDMSDEVFLSLTICIFCQ